VTFRSCEIANSGDSLISDVTDNSSDDFKLSPVAGVNVCRIQSDTLIIPGDPATVVEASIPSLLPHRALSPGRWHDSLAEVGISRCAEDIIPLDITAGNVLAIQFDVLIITVDPAMVSEKTTLFGISTVGFKSRDT
jgi:hypothetical protein